MLGIVSLAALLNYDKLIKRLVVQWPTAWAQADDKTRAERLESIPRAGKSMPANWDADAHEGRGLLEGAS